MRKFYALGQPGNWSCMVCGSSFAWKEFLYPPPNDELGPTVIDRGPFRTTLGSKTYDACSLECLKDGAIVKTLEKMFEKFPEQTSQHQHKFGDWKLDRGFIGFAYKACVGCNVRMWEKVKVIQERGQPIFPSNPDVPGPPPESLSSQYPGDMFCNRCKRYVAPELGKSALAWFFCPHCKGTL